MATLVIMFLWCEMFHQQKQLIIICEYVDECRQNIFWKCSVMESSINAPPSVQLYYMQIYPTVNQYKYNKVQYLLLSWQVITGCRGGKSVMCWGGRGGSGGGGGEWGRGGGGGGV